MMPVMYQDFSEGKYEDDFKKLDIGNIVPFELKVIDAVVNNEFATINLRETRNVSSNEPFILDEEFIQKYEGKEPDWGELGWFTFKRTYARRVENELGETVRTEEWTEVVRRVVEGNLSIIPNDPLATQEYGQKMYDLIWNLVFTPPGRGLWMGGTEFSKRTGDSSNNCWFVETRPHYYGETNKIFTRHEIDPKKKYVSYPFVFLFDQAMKGGGVGFSAEQHVISEIPSVENKIKLYIHCNKSHQDIKELEEVAETYDIRLNEPVGENETVVELHVADSREGWAESLAVAIDSHFLGEDTSVVIDVTEVRHRGLPIKGFGGVASGPAPLVELLGFVSYLVSSRVGNKLSSVDVGDIHNAIGRAVVAGNVRRCLPEGTMVHMEKGLTRIENVKVGDLVATSKGYEQVTDWVYQGEQEVLTIKHQMGTFQCTPKHKIAVMVTTTGDYEWKMAKDLKQGDRMIFVDNEIPGIETHLPDWTYEKPENSTTCQEIIIPKLDEGIAWLLGFFHGDGYVFPNFENNGFNAYVSISLDSRQTELIDKIKTQLSRFGTNVSVRPNGKEENCTRISATSKQLAWYFSKFKTANETINIPDFILKGQPEIRKAYLAGLYDADGTVKNRPIKVVTSIFPDYLKQVQALYASIGIPVRMSGGKEREKENWKPLYFITVVGENSIKTFEEKIVPYTHKYQNNRKTSRSQNDYGFPREMVVSEGVIGKSFQSKQMTTGRYEKKTGNLVKLIPVAVDEIVYDGSIVKTYDISVGQAQEFVAQEGLLVHNTAEINFGSPDDSDFINQKDYTKVSHVMKGWDENSRPILKTVEELIKEGYSKEQAEADIYMAWAQGNHRWASNNSIIVDDPRGYDFGFISPAIETNGEPGILNRWLMQNFGRIIDGYRAGVDGKATGANPCFLGSMKLLTEDGYQTFEDLDGKQVNVVNAKGEITSGKVWCSGEKEVVEVKFLNRPSIICTPDHTFMLNNEEECEAKDLKGKRIMPFIQEGSEFDDMFTFLGFVQGDGQTTGLLKKQRGIYVDIGRKDKEVFDLLESLEYEYVQHKGSTSGYFVQGLRDSMVDLGFVPKILPERTLPTKYNSFSYKQKASFLRGLYSANGSAIRTSGGCRVGFKTTCEELANQLVETLDKDFNIKAYITKSKKKVQKFHNGVYTMKAGYGVNIAEYRSKLIFIEEIGFLQRYKMNRLVDGMIRSAPMVNSVKRIEGVHKVYDFTEPNIHWGVVEGVVAHNCCEISLESNEPCNLAEYMLPVALKRGIKHEDIIPFLVHYTKRVTFTNYDWEESARVISENRRLGVSLSGVADWVLMKFGRGAIIGWKKYKLEEWHDMVWLTDDKPYESFEKQPEYDITTHRIEPVFNPELLREIDDMYKLVVQSDIEFSHLLTEHMGYEVKPSIKRTTNKPSGTVALLPFVSPGVHFHYFKHGVRRIRVQKSDPLLDLTRQAGYHVEEAIENPGSYVIEFPVEAPSAQYEDFRCAADVTIEEQFAMQSLMAVYWADNMVSCTITFHEDEKPKIKHMLDQYRMRIKSTSLLPYFGHGYVQPPYEPYVEKEVDGKVLSPEEQYRNAKKKIKFKPQDLYHALKQQNNFRDEELTLEDSLECTTGVCPIR